MNLGIRTIYLHIFVIVIYSLMTLIMTYPVISNITSSIAGSGGDPWQTLWRFEYKDQEMRQALWEESSNATDIVKYVRNEFFGGGDARLVNISIWPWMWLHWLFGEPTAYNLVFLLSFILSGYGMFLLVQYLARKEIKKLRNREIEKFGNKEIKNEGKFLNYLFSQFLPNAGPFITGIVYMFLPYHVAHAHGHFGAMQTQWLPFIILAAISFIEKPNIVKSLILSFLIILQAWSEHHYMAWLVIAAFVACVMFRSNIAHMFTRKKSIFSLTVTGVMIFVFVILPYIPTIQLASRKTSSIAVPKEQIVRLSADIASFFIPPSWHPLWGKPMEVLFGSRVSGNEIEATQYVGLVVILIVVFYRYSLPKKSSRLLFSLLTIFILISIGPQLKIFGSSIPIPLPYDIIDTFPIIDTIRAVGRGGVIIGLVISILFGYVTASQIRRWQTMVFLFIIIIVDFLFFPFPMQTVQRSQAYEILSTQEGTAIIEIPAATNYVVASRSLYESVFHKKQVLGNIALERAFSQDTLQTLKQIPVIRQLLYLRTTELIENRKEFFNQDLDESFPDVVQWLSIGAVLVHPDSLSKVQLNAVTNFLENDIGLLRTSYDDIYVYKTHNLIKPILSDGLFLIRKEGWTNIGYDPKRGSVFGEVLEQADLTLVNVRDAATDVEITFRVPKESEGSLSMSLDSKQIAVFDNQREKSIAIVTSIPPGEHQLRIQNTGMEKLIIQDPSIVVR